MKAFIFAEMFLWSGWNFIMPIFAIYITKLPSGNVERAASSVSVYLMARVFSGLISGRYLTGKRARHKYVMTMAGMSILGLSYIGMAYSKDVLQLFLFYGLSGVGLGIASPAKNTLFSSSIKSEKATLTWGLLDAGVLTAMAITAAVGGTIAENFGFKFLFFVAAAVNFIALIPYVIYYDYWRKQFVVAKG